MRMLISYAKTAFAAGIAVSGFFWALGLTEPTRKFRSMVLNNTSIRG